LGSPSVTTLKDRSMHCERDGAVRLTFRTRVWNLDVRSIAKDFDSRVVCDGCCSSLFGKTPFASFVRSCEGRRMAGIS